MAKKSTHNTQCSNLNWLFSLAFAALLLLVFLIVMFGCTGETRMDTSENTNVGQAHTQPTDPSTDAQRTPEDSLQRLVDGNATYLSGQNTSDISAERREDTAENGQAPFAVVVTCSDSRVPPELLFDAGIGDIFVIRTAGNVVGPFELGSIEYGVEHVGAPLVVVLGHTNCGAVNAALEGHADGNIQSIVDEIAAGIGDEQDSRTAVTRNISHSLERITQSDIVARRIAEGTVKLQPALYDIETGEVTWL